jgi:hypothetical protein
MFDRFDPAFEPSSQAKEAMQYVRKRSRLLGGIRHPGLFGIHGYTVDWSLFLVALLLEAVGLAALYFVISGQDQAPPLGGTVLVVAAAFVVDIVLAFYHHRFATGINSVLAIESTLASKIGGTENHVVVETNTDRIRARHRISAVLSVALFLAAGLKFVLVWGLGEGASELKPLLAFIAVAYFITAVIHIKVTGYLLHAVWAGWLYGRDIEKFKRSKATQCVASDHVIELSDYPDFEKPITVQAHAIVTDHKPGTTQPVFLLKCRGLLFDHEIEEFSNRIIDGKARSELVLRAMELQESGEDRSRFSGQFGARRVRCTQVDV